MLLCSVCPKEPWQFPVVTSIDGHSSVACAPQLLRYCQQHHYPSSALHLIQWPIQQNTAGRGNT